MTGKKYLPGVYERMQEQAVPYLGREHFMACGEAWGHNALARVSFGLLTARKTFPNDLRKPDFEDMGLDIVTRSSVDMGPIPEYARMHHNTRSTSPTYHSERYAIGTESLGDLVQAIGMCKIDRPPRLGVASVQFLGDLVMTASGRELL